MAAPVADTEGAAMEQNRRQATFALAAAAGVCSGLLPMRPARAGSFVPNETLVSPAIDLIDIEYSQDRAMYARVDNSARLWVGDIDRATGDFVDPTGMQILADIDTMNTGDLIWVYTGAEWMQTPDGDEVLYTKFVHGKRHTVVNARIGIATTAPNGQWSGGLLGPDLPRFDIFGSEDTAGGRPALYYLDELKNKRWRNLDDPAEEILPGTTPQGANALRFVRGARAIAYRLQVNGTWQAFRYDLDTRVLEQLTFDGGQKSLVWMWRAPEFGGDFVLMVLVNSREIRIYRNLPDGDGVPKWTVIHSVAGPRGSSIQSLEPFTYGGRSFYFMDMELPPNDFPSEIWFGNIDANQPIWRRINDNTVLNVRTDPEYFITDHGPIIYYNRFVPHQPKQDGALGLYRADPGVNDL
jgi:hypothetical protein